MSHPGLAPLARARISLAGVSILQSAYRIGRLGPAYHVVIATVSGRGMLRIAEGECSLEKGSLLCLPAGSSYEYRLAGPQWGIVWFHLRRRKRWAGFARLGVRIVRNVSLDPLVGDVDAIMEESLSPSRNATRAAELHAELLVLHLDRLLEGGRSGSEMRHEESLRTLWSEVDASLHEPWSVARLARAMHMAPGHFHRVVVELHGATPMAFVATLRMQRAESLLRRGDLTVAQVAERVGYADAFAFSTAFKRWKGVPPSKIVRE